MKIIPNKLVISIILALIIVSYLLILVSNNSNNNNNNKNENSKHNNMYLITNSENSCQKQDELIIVYVFISVLSFERRNLIRNTWSNKNIFPQLKTLFIVGKAPTNKLNEQIAYENLIYGDLIQGNFIETNNKSNTLKSLITWKWISDYCSLANINYVLKVNEYDILNTFNLLKYLNNDGIKMNANEFCCFNLLKKYVLQSNKQKHFTIFNSSVCIGSFITSMNMILNLNKITYKYNKQIRNDLVNTAVLAQHLNASYKNIFNLYVPSKFYDKINAQTYFHLFILDCYYATDFLHIWSTIINNNYLHTKII